MYQPVQAVVWLTQSTSDRHYAEQLEEHLALLVLAVQIAVLRVLVQQQLAQLITHLSMSNREIDRSLHGTIEANGRHAALP